MPKNILVSIIIVNYNTRELVKNCLSSILKLTEGLTYEVIIVDNASEDDLQDLIAKEFPWVKLINSKVNLGFGKANNLAAEHALGTFLFFLNSDTVLLNNAVKLLSDYLLSNKTMGICGANLYNAELMPATSFSQTMPGIYCDVDYFFFNMFTRVRHGKNLNFNYTDRPMAVDGFISGADLMIRTDIFKSLKGFDRDFFMYYEETELTYRVKQLGFLVASVPAAKILHLEGASEVVKEASLRRTFASKLLYYKKTGMHKKFFAAHVLSVLIAFQRIFLFFCLRKPDKLKLWKKLLEIENECYRSSST